MRDGTGRPDVPFQRVVDAVGGADRPDWLATATLDATVRESLASLASTLADGTDGSPARAYQTRLAETAQASTGHFVTAPGIAAACCRWAIQPRDDGAVPRVLDPATGGGVFLAAADRRLASLCPAATTAERLARLVGVDLDPVALSLTAHALLDRLDPPVESPLPLYEADFFDVEPGLDERVHLDGDTVVAGQFDAVVGNPPYLRQETLDTERVRAHLATFGPEGETPYLNGDRALSRRSDAYVYFLTHATRFLREGGRLAVVVPTKWLATRYGESLQRFLFDHYRVEAVVGFDARAFDGALVDTALLFAERRADASDRRSTPVRFCRLDDQRTVPALLDALEAAGSTPDGESLAVHEDDGFRAVTRRQGCLVDAGPGKRGHYLTAPVPLVRLLESDELVPLSALASVRRGVMTGANDFFFLSGSASGVDDRFLAPAIKSIRDVEDRLLTANDTDRYLLDVHEYVRSVLDGNVDTGAPDNGTDDRSEDPSAKVVDALVADGHDALAAYVARGERKGYHERRSCAARRVWFDLGELSAPDVFVPKFFDRRVFAIANPDGLLASNAVDCLLVADAVDTRVLLGVLNSTVVRALLECWGRAEGGGALQLMTYELTTLPVPDPRTFDPATATALREATDALLEGGATGEPTRRLDALVLDAIGSDLSVDRLRDCRGRMVDRRVDRGPAGQSPIREP